MLWYLKNSIVQYTEFQWNYYLEELRFDQEKEECLRLNHKILECKWSFYEILSSRLI